MTSRPLGTISALMASRIWKSLRRSSSQLLQDLEAADVLDVRSVGDVLDHAGAVDEQVLFLEEYVHRGRA